MVSPLTNFINTEKKKSRKMEKELMQELNSDKPILIKDIYSIDKKKYPNVRDYLNKGYLCNEDLNREITIEDLNKVESFLNDSTSMINPFLPMVCKDTYCPMFDTCLLAKSGMAKIGEKCRVEIGQVLMWTEKLISSLNVQPDEISTILLVQQLVATLIICQRSLAIMASSNLTIEQETSLKGGEVAVQTIEHPVAKTYRDTLKMQITLMNSLLATREKKNDAIKGISLSTIDLVSKMHELQRVDIRNAVPRKEIVSEEDE